MTLIAVLFIVWSVVTGVACFLRGERGPAVPPPPARRFYVWMP